LIVSAFASADRASTICNRACERIDAATDHADQDVIERIAAHIVKASKTPWTGVPLLDEAGEIRYRRHFFLDWTDGLLDGAFSRGQQPLAMQGRRFKVILDALRGNLGRLSGRLLTHLSSPQNTMGGWDNVRLDCGERWGEVSRMVAHGNGS
jgi:hypothetical protein